MGVETAILAGSLALGAASAGTSFAQGRKAQKEQRKAQAEQQQVLRRQEQKTAAAERQQLDLLGRQRRSLLAGRRGLQQTFTGPETGVGEGLFGRRTLG